MISNFLKRYHSDLKIVLMSFLQKMPSKVVYNGYYDPHIKNKAIVINRTMFIGNDEYEILEDSLFDFKEWLVFVGYFYGHRITRIFHKSTNKMIETYHIYCSKISVKYISYLGNLHIFNRLALYANTKHYIYDANGKSKCNYISNDLFDKDLLYVLSNVSDIDHGTHLSVVNKPTVINRNHLCDLDINIITNDL